MNINNINSYSTAADKTVFNIQQTVAIKVKTNMISGSYNCLLSNNVINLV